MVVFSKSHVGFAFLAIFGFLALVVEYGHLRGIRVLPKFSKPSIPWLSTPSDNSRFWIAFAPILAAAAPQCPPPELLGKVVADVRVVVPGSGSVADRSNNNLKMEEKDVNSMRESHASFVEQIRNSTLELAYEKGTKGIVTSAGGLYFPVLLISLQFLRRTGSTLPVEVFLQTPDEYEHQTCDVLLPALNAKCIILSDIIDQSEFPFTITHYQLKAFSMLFSSFEHILFLDADDFPARPPEPLFESEPYISNHLVLWPDYWTPTVSPFLYSITGLEEGILDSRPTIEAGQILVSKRHHMKTLLLAAYYNCYGDHYYHLTTQGGPGEGDKETFSLAALVLKAPFYTVTYPTHPLGMRRGGCVLQPHPEDDFNAHGDNDVARRSMFVHASWPPKLNPMHMYHPAREWGPAERSKELFDGMDIELVAWGYMVEMACNGKLEFKDWMEEENKNTDVCGRTRKSFLDMFKQDYNWTQKEEVIWNKVNLGGEVQRLGR